MLLWLGLLVTEVTNLRKFVKGGFKLSVSKDFSTYILWFAVLGLIFDRFQIPWVVLVIVSVIFLSGLLYFALMQWRYSGLLSMLSIPINLYPVKVGIRLFTFSTGVVLLAYGHADSVYMGFSALSLLILLIVLWYSAMEMEKLIRSY